MAIIYETVNLYNQKHGINPWRYLGSDQHNNPSYFCSNHDLKKDIQLIGPEHFIKNILEEFLQEKGLDLSPDATQRLKVDIVYLDVLTTKKNISVFHSNEEEVVIRLKGTLYKDGKKDKEVMVEESSSEISMSTLIVDEGGKFNQTSLSNALKKGCDKLITKLLGK